MRGRTPMAITRRVRRIGNSRAVVLPKDVLEHLGSPDSVELTLERGRVVLSPVPRTKGTGNTGLPLEEAMTEVLEEYAPALRYLAEMPDRQDLSSGK
jgi:antitoxin component of MazEF toxin-antitoxin module